MKPVIFFKRIRGRSFAYVIGEHGVTYAASGSAALGEGLRRALRRAEDAASARRAGDAGVWMREVQP